MDLKDKKICFLGDSITEGVGVSKSKLRFPDVFKRITDIGVVKNYGVSGTTIAKQVIAGENDESSFCERFEHMDDDADIIVVFGGTNDFGHGEAPFGKETDRHMDTFCGACHYLMSNLIKKYPKAVIVFMTPLLH